MGKVQVYVYAELRRFTGGVPAVEVDVQPGQTIAMLLDKLGIPREQTKIVFLNNRAVDPSCALNGGERVDLFSAIGGG